MGERIAITVGGQRATTRGPLSDTHLPVRSLYIHVPFCFHKCHYCDFYSFVDTQERQAEFVELLERELRTLAPHAGVGSSPRLDTIFVGGGTPSLLHPDLWTGLLSTMDECFGVRQFPDTPGAEFTIECNPETVTSELMAIFRAGGVTRTSMGAQSFNDAHLKTLERWHDPENVNRALELAASAGIARRSIDLIFGIPGQSLKDWENDLDRALALSGGIEHISCYALTYEPNTAMTARLKRGEFDAIDEDIEVAMQRHTVARLREAGFERYEVSNFAKCSPSHWEGAGGRDARQIPLPLGGGEGEGLPQVRGEGEGLSSTACAHNLVYWRQGQWLAAGPSASAHVGGHRWKNVPHLTEWMQGIERSAGYSPMVDHETPDARRLLTETLMTGLRLSEGVDAESMLTQADRFNVAPRLRRRAAFNVERGFLVDDGSRWTLTDEGFLFADGVAADLMAAVRE